MTQGDELGRRRAARQAAQDMAARIRELGNGLTAIERAGDGLLLAGVALTRMADLAAECMPLLRRMVDLVDLADEAVHQGTRLVDVLERVADQPDQVQP